MKTRYVVDSGGCGSMTFTTDSEEDAEETARTWLKDEAKGDEVDLWRLVSRIGNEGKRYW